MLDNIKLNAIFDNMKLNILYEELKCFYKET